MLAIIYKLNWLVTPSSSKNLANFDPGTAQHHHDHPPAVHADPAMPTEGIQTPRWVCWLTSCQLMPIDANWSWKRVIVHSEAIHWPSSLREEDSDQQNLQQVTRPEEIKPYHLYPVPLYPDARWLQSPSKGASSWLPQQREGLIIWVPFFIDQKYDQQQILLTIYIYKLYYIYNIYLYLIITGWLQLPYLLKTI